MCFHSFILQYNCKNKMPNNKKKSKIWNYFKKCDNDKGVICKFCNKNLKTSGNTTNMRGHLEKVHPEYIQQLIAEEPVQKKKRTCDADDEEVQTEQLASTSAAADVDCSYVPDIASALGSSSSVTTSNTTIQPRQESVEVLFNNIKSVANVEGNKHKKITESIVNFIILDHKPFSVVEGKGFIQLIKEIVPLYKVPSRETFKKRIDDKYEVMSVVFKKYIQEAEHYCITYDIWTEAMRNKSFVGVTTHFLEKSKLRSVSLGVFELFEKHTAEYVQRKLTEIFQEWNISTDKVTAIVTDNDSTVMKVNRDMFGEKKIIPCFAHTVNLVVTNSLDKSQMASAIINKVREIVKFMKRSVNASDELRKKQKENSLMEGKVKKLILDVRTRWNSTYYMLERFIELIEIIGAILLCRPDAPPMIVSSEIGCLREIIQLLQPFERLTKEVCAQHFITVSKVIPLVSCLRGMLEKYSGMPFVYEATLSLKLEIEKEVTKRFDKLEHCSSLAIATALDPRFKLIHFKDATAKGKVINYINNYLASNLKNVAIANESSDESEKGDNPEGDIWSYHKTLTHYNIKNKTKDKSKADTELQILAMIYLPIVATSVPSERLFSEAGATITQERNRLLGTRLSKLLFLNSIMKK
ncbi:hypothetical protein K1T71_002914 [Dendrolimus kikuchii]|uniref:Uncharacterized protein n=1 Tax=Dendrolimus kikuchii TaxID=765133 RepID=A0ACC1DA30_9NEOP|nr:hypothetical protein K1T71_002914 [Dendrolimus kikuchii]